MPDHDSSHAMPAPAYPLGVATAYGDARFTINLTMDVASVLTRHGYPPMESGHDLLHLEAALFQMIYVETP